MSLPRGRQGARKFGKRPGSGPRDRRPPRMRRESNSGTRMNSNAHNSPAPLSADAVHFEEPPQWFFMYMESFKKDLISEMLKSLDSPLEEEEKRRRYKKSYFMLKSRLHKLEKQMEEQSYHNGAQTSQQNGAARNTQNLQNIRNSTCNVQSAESNGQEDSAANTSPLPSARKDIKKSEKISREGKKSQKSPRSEEKKEKSPENSGNSHRSSSVDEKLEGCDEKPSNSDGKNSTIENSSKTITKPQENEFQLQELSKKIRSVLNKLAPSNFHSLLEQVKNFNISTPLEEEMVINHLFEKAMDDPMYSTTYALMCKQFVLLQPSILRLRRLILSKCETEFKAHTSRDKLKVKLLQEMKEAEEEALKKDLQEELAEIEKNPKKFMGDILFIGELYNQDLLSNNFLHKVIQHFLQSSNETDLEYLCKLLKISGKNFECRGEDPTFYYEQLTSIAEREDLTSRIKFMIKDLMDIRLKGWVGRREDPEDDFLEIFSFSKALDDACDAGSEDDIREKFYRQIQSQFNFFESANFTRELLNSAIERNSLRKHYFDVFRRSDGNKIPNWVGGDEVFLGIIFRELKLFFTDVHELSRDIPEAYECLKEFLEVIIADWLQKFNPGRLLDVLEGLRGSGRAGKFVGEVFQGLKEKIGEERIKKWIDGNDFAFGEFLISEGEKVEEILEKYGLEFLDEK